MYQSLTLNFSLYSFICLVVLEVYFGVAVYFDACFFVQVWVLTGDKQETAVNISHSCGHFKVSYTKLFVQNLH